MWVCRLQVMCYRVLLHVLVTEGLPLRAFCAHFGLNAAERLSPAFLEQLGPLEVGAEVRYPSILAMPAHFSHVLMRGVGPGSGWHMARRGSCVGTDLCPAAPHP